MRSLLAILVYAGTIAASPRILVKLDSSAGSTPRDGRLILIVSKEMKGEPRCQVTWAVKTQQIFGKDIDGWKHGDTVEITADTPGDPMRTLADLPAGTYNLQAVLNVYETFRRSDGHVLKLHPDHGEGQRPAKSGRTWKREANGTPALNSDIVAV